MFTGTCIEDNNDSLLSTYLYKNGLLDSDSAIVIRYNNTVLKSVTKYKAGKFISFKKIDYYMICAVVDGKYNTTVSKEWLATRNSLSLKLIEPDKKEIVTANVNNLLTDSTLNIDNYKIVSFVFSPTWCDNCVDVDYSSNSNQITEEMRNSVREYKSADGCFYFSLIKCQFDGKNIDLNDIKFKVY